MNCKKIHQEILDRLAAGETPLPAALEAHQASCAACREYYRSQVGLFHSIDRGLGVMANAPMPPSLLPAVRARLDGRQQVTGMLSFRGWTFAAFAATALAMIAFLFFGDRSIQPSNKMSQVARATAPRTVQPKQGVPAVAPASKRAAPVANSPKRLSSAKSDVVSSPKESTPEVMVLAEEREAFARFIAQVPENPAAAIALTQPMPRGDEAVMEIALLTIKPGEVKPLELSEE